MTGPDEFSRQAAALGLDGVRQEGHRVFFTIELPAGQYAGQSREICAEVPTDFPLTPPPGPHVRPATVHPAGAVQASPVGDDWIYWSRPAPNWATDRSVRAWVRHVRSLFAQL